jgi:hypothetical protein
MDKEQRKKAIFDRCRSVYGAIVEAKPSRQLGQAIEAGAPFEGLAPADKLTVLGVVERLGLLPAAAASTPAAASSSSATPPAASAPAAPSNGAASDPIVADGVISPEGDEIPLS